MEEMRSDVVIVGGGLSGTLAALGLAKAGRCVTVLRDGRGASPNVAGFNLPGAEEGDSAERFLDDTVKSANGQSDPALAGMLCNGAARLTDYLNRLGFAPDVDANGRLKARKSLGSTYARVVGRGNSTGADILALADRQLRETGSATVLPHTRALRLLTQNGSVSGVLAYDKEREKLFTVRASCVLMACGGYAGIFPFSTNTPDIAGDGIAMGLLAGAHATDLEFVQFEPSAAVWPESLRGKGMITTLFYEGACLTDAKGERFMLRYSGEGERVNKDVLAKCIARELREGRGTIHHGVYFDARGVDRQRMLDAYAPFVKRYRDVGIDLCSEPVEIANAAHTALGGLKVDRNCETDLPGLYAIGEALGNLHGANRLGGSAGTETLVFPQYAAKAILERLASADGAAEAADPGKKPLLRDPSKEPLSPDRIAGINQRLADILDRSLGVCRDGKGLSSAVSGLETLLEEERSFSPGPGDRGVFEAFSLENKLITALALAKSALLRDDSVGCHWRLDRDLPPAERYRTDVSMNGRTIQTIKIKF